MSSEIALRPFYTVMCVFLIGNYWTSTKQTARKKFIDRISYNPSRKYGIRDRYKMLPESIISDKYEKICGRNTNGHGENQTVTGGS